MLTRSSLVVMLFVLGCGGSQPRGAFIPMAKHAPDEWFKAFSAGGVKLGCEVKDQSHDEGVPAGTRILTANCKQRKMFGTLLDGDDGRTSAMCDATDKRQVTEDECARFLDELMNAGRAK